MLDTPEDPGTPGRSATIPTLFPETREMTVPPARRTGYMLESANALSQLLELPVLGRF